MAVSSSALSARRLAVATIAATALTATASAAILALVEQGGRIRETGFYSLGKLPLQAGVNVFRALPDSLSQFASLRGFSPWLEFAAGSFVANLALNFLLAAAAGLVGRAVWARLPARLQRAELPGMMLVLVAPVAALAARVTGESSLVSWASAGALTAVFFGALLASEPFGGLLIRASVGAGRAGLALGALLVIGGATSRLLEPARPEAPATPNVLLISIDSLRADHLSSYGYSRQTSPRMDRLAADGARFESVVAPTSWTLPSHVSMLTGLDVLEHGVWQFDRRLSNRTPTLAGRLRDQGYATAAVVAAPFLNATWGFSQGFDFYDDYTVGRSGDGADHVEITSPQVVAGARKWLEAWADSGSERPFFLFLHFWDVHYDYNPPPPYDKAFDTGYKGPVTGENFETDEDINARLDPEAVAFLQSQYDGEILYTDEHVGRAADTLDSLDQLDNTLIVITSDHGDEFFEHGEKGHRKSLYDEVLLVPLIMRLPGRIPAGTVVERPVRLIDMVPTILALTGAEPLEADAGAAAAARDLSPLLLDPETPEPARVAFADLHGGELQAIRTHDRKLIVGEKGMSELYDLVADPGEQEDLAFDRLKESAAFKRAVRAWADGADSGAVEKASQSAEQVEVLKSLGYL